MKIKSPINPPSLPLRKKEVLVVFLTGPEGTVLSVSTYTKKKDPSLGKT